MKKLLILLIAIPLIANGDPWKFEAKREVTEFEFGDTKILRIVDATENQRYPMYRVDIVTSGELVGRYGGLSFEHIEANPGNDMFVALSNKGLPSTALAIFDAAGNLRLLLDHNADTHKFEYCDKSVTLIREWFDSASPKLTFLEDELVVDIKIRSCDGRTLSLREIVQQTSQQ